MKSKEATITQTEKEVTKMEKKQEELTEIQCPICYEKAVSEDAKAHRPADARDYSNTIFLGWQAYAAHIKAMHSDDTTRMQWAKDMEAQNANSTELQAPQVVRGKPEEMIPPSRKMPKYIKKQLAE